jgi:4-hydroxy-tetrahydrodipicolinate synthase
MKFQGSFVALVTPFKNDAVNEEKVRELVRLHIENGTDGIVAAGTTGEAPTLSGPERERLFEVVVDEAAGRIKVIAGTGSYDTAHSANATRRAQQLGVDAALIVTPYYNKPTQRGLFAHFEAIAEACDLPLIVYNVPGRTSVNLTAETMLQLADIDSVVAVKEASGDLGQISEIAANANGRITVLSGDDNLTAAILAVGGEGVISVTANIIPRDIKKLCDLFAENNLPEGRALHHRLLRINNAMFYEPNPIPVKTAMNMMGMEVGKFRLPLAPMAESNKQRLQGILNFYELL